MPKSIKKEICPRCNDQVLADPILHNALSRRDNKTYICSACGEREALCDFFKYNSIPVSEISVEQGFHKKIKKPYSKYKEWHKTTDKKEVWNKNYRSEQEERCRT